jgi:hypothetical protein
MLELLVEGDRDALLHVLRPKRHLRDLRRLCRYSALPESTKLTASVPGFSLLFRPSIPGTMSLPGTITSVPAGTRKCGVHFGVLASALGVGRRHDRIHQAEMDLVAAVAKIAKVALAPGFSSSGGFLSNVAVILSAPQYFSHRRTG